MFENINLKYYNGKDSEFNYTSFYYQYHDYKNPRVIFLYSRPPLVDDILDYNRPNYDYDKLSFFNEKLDIDGIVKNKQYDFFNNSFFIFASCEEFYNEFDFVICKYSKTELKLINFLGTSITSTRENQLKNITDYRQNISNLKSEIESINNRYTLEIEPLNNQDRLAIESLNNKYISEIKAIKNNINKLTCWLPIRKWSDNFRNKMMNTDQTRPDQTRPDQTRPDQTMN